MNDVFGILFANSCCSRKKGKRQDVKLLSCGAHTRAHITESHDGLVPLTEAYRSLGTAGTFRNKFDGQSNNQSAEGAGGLGIIRGNKVGESDRDSNVEFANLHCNNNDKK